MTDPTVDPDTPAAPAAAPSKAHGDAFLDQSGSRHGAPPAEPATPDPADATDAPPGDPSGA